VTQLSIRLSISVDAARNGLLSAAHKFIPDESPAAATVGTPAASSRVGGVTGTGSMSRTRTRTPARSNTDRAGSYFPLLADR
jgi:hypothetical protein